MNLKIENAICDYLKKSLNRDMGAMVQSGHSTLDRKTPYIVVDCSDAKPFGGLFASDGIFELNIDVRIADSAHDINYSTQQKRITAVMELLSAFDYHDDDLLINYFEYEANVDARDDNNIGNVLTYKCVFQKLTS